MSQSENQMLHKVFESWFSDISKAVVNSLKALQNKIKHLESERDKYKAELDAQRVETENLMKLREGII